MGNGHWQLEGSAAGERTPGANAFVLALDEVLGTGASCIKRGEHSFADPARLEALLKGARFGAVEVQTVVQKIAFPSVLDYVRFQLFATSMTVLLKGPNGKHLSHRSRPRPQRCRPQRCTTAANLYFHRRRMSPSHVALADHDPSGTQRPSVLRAEPHWGFI